MKSVNSVSWYFQLHLLYHVKIYNHYNLPCLLWNILSTGIFPSCQSKTPSCWGGKKVSWLLGSSSYVTIHAPLLTVKMLLFRWGVICLVEERKKGEATNKCTQKPKLLQPRYTHWKSLQPVPLAQWMCLRQRPEFFFMSRMNVSVSHVLREIYISSRMEIVKVYAATQCEENDHAHYPVWMLLRLVLQ